MVAALGLQLAPREDVSALAASPDPQSGPVLTSVVDTVYLAGGSPAQGVLIITWPGFVAANGAAVAAGVMNVTLGVNGALNVALASNAGANPPGAYYTDHRQRQVKKPPRRAACLKHTSSLNS